MFLTQDAFWSHLIEQEPSAMLLNKAKAEVDGVKTQHVFWLSIWVQLSVASYKNERHGPCYVMDYLQFKPLQLNDASALERLTQEWLNLDTNQTLDESYLPALAVDDFLDALWNIPGYASHVIEYVAQYVASTEPRNSTYIQFLPNVYHLVASKIIATQYPLDESIYKFLSYILLDKGMYLQNTSLPISSYQAQVESSLVITPISFWSCMRYCLRKKEDSSFSQSDLDKYWTYVEPLLNQAPTFEVAWSLWTLVQQSDIIIAEDFLWG